MSQRTFTAILAFGVLAVGTATSFAQPARLPVLGFLGMDSQMQSVRNAAFLDGLRQLGYVDYGLGYALTPAWRVGLNGYLYKQLTNDELNGVVVPDGNKGQAVAVGPFIRYHPSKNFGIAFKWQHEYLVENRASGNRFFLQNSAQLW